MRAMATMHSRKERDEKHAEHSDDKHWIAGATKHPGALHKALHVPEGEKIPAKKLAKAEDSKSPRVRREAALANTLRGFHHGKKRR